MKQFVNERSIAISIIMVSAGIGFSIHPFYDWTGADQSRPVALLWQVPLTIAVGLALCCLSLPWIPLEREVCTSGNRYQISLRLLMSITAVISVLLAIAINSPSTFSDFMLLVVSLALSLLLEKIPYEPLARICISGGNVLSLYLGLFD